MWMTVSFILFCLFILIFVGIVGYKKYQKNQTKARLKIEREEAKRLRAEADKNKPSKVIISGNTPSKFKRGRSSVILLVEDSPTMLLTLRKLLERWNYKVITATNGREAWTELQKTKPDLMISDIEMPELSGIELVKLMRSDLMLMDVPVILITANVDEYAKVPQIVEVDGLLKKPFEDKILLDQLRYILQE